MKAWGLRMLIGPAMVIDGVFHFPSFGCFSAGLSLECARQLSIARMKARMDDLDKRQQQMLGMKD